MPSASALSPELLKIIWEAAPRGPLPVTYSAAWRRFERATKHRQRICKLNARERSRFGGATHALVENNTIIATGRIDTVEEWCRDELVLMPHEFLKEAA